MSLRPLFHLLGVIGLVGMLGMLAGLAGGGTHSPLKQRNNIGARQTEHAIAEG